MKYWAIPCRVCGGMIALTYVLLDAEGKAVTPTPNEDPFQADCQLCRNAGTYTRSQIVMWEGPQPAPDFRPHPAFQITSAA